MGDVLDNITIEQFKELFKRDFEFLPVYVLGHIYFKDDIVYYNSNFFKSLSDNNEALPTDSTMWEPVQVDEDNYITDDDIQKAMNQAKVVFNTRFGANIEQMTNIFLHLVAYYLMIDLSNASSTGGFLGVTSSKSVGDVSESYAIPAFVSNSPLYSMYMQNGYGLKYLSMILPFISGRVLLSRGRTTYG